MAWKYEQTTGRLSLDGFLEGRGYSGHAKGRNNPAMQDVPCVGPCPQGWYTLGPVHDTQTHGPVVMALTPDKENEMYGRAGFLVHGDNRLNDASQGCIILPRSIREQMAKSDCKRLQVVA